MLGVEVWAEVRRRHLADGQSIKRIARETGLARNTVRAALRREGPPAYRRVARGSVLDAYRGWVEELLAVDAALPGEVVLERLRAEGYAAGRTIGADERVKRHVALPDRGGAHVNVVAGPDGGPSRAESRRRAAGSSPAMRAAASAAMPRVQSPCRIGRSKPFTRAKRRGDL